MGKDDWDKLLAKITSIILQKADEEVEGEFPTSQEILDKLSEFRAAIRDPDDYLSGVKSALIDYTIHSVRVNKKQ
jgi:hypothetical protein